MKNGLAASVVILVVIIGAAAGYFMGVSNTHIATTTTTSYKSATYTSTLNNGIYLMKVNGSFYWADDVSKDIVIGMPGYSYFLNGSVTFDGVKFQTICPPSYRDCPGSNSSSTIIYAGAIRFNMTFLDGCTETTGNVIGDSIYMFVLRNTIRGQACSSSMSTTIHTIL